MSLAFKSFILSDSVAYTVCPKSLVHDCIMSRYTVYTYKFNQRRTFCPDKRSRINKERLLFRGSRAKPRT